MNLGILSLEVKFSKNYVVYNALNDLLSVEDYRVRMGDSIGKWVGCQTEG